LTAVVFDDAYSILHAVLGAVVRLIKYYNIPLALVIIITFIIYQIRESEKDVYTLGDVLEFLVGYVIADVIICC